jgi:hypothetical protein
MMGSWKQLHESGDFLDQLREIFKKDCAPQCPWSHYFYLGSEEYYIIPQSV